MMEKLYTPEGAAEALMVSPKTVREWLRTGKLGGVKVGRLWRVRESDLETFLAGGQAAEMAPPKALEKSDKLGKLLVEMMDQEKKKSG